MTTQERLQFWARAEIVARAWRGWTVAKKLTATPRGLGSPATLPSLAGRDREHAWRVVEVAIRDARERGVDPREFRAQLRRVADGMRPTALRSEVEDAMHLAIAIGLREWGLP